MTRGRWWKLVLGASFAASLVGVLGLLGGLTLRYVNQAVDRGGYFDPNLRGAAWHQLGLRSLSEAFPTRTVSRGGEIAVLPESPRDLGELSFEHDGRQLGFDEFLERNHTHGIVVLHRGEVVYERYFAGADAGSRFTSWSVAKSFTATLVGIALADGRIRSLDDSIETYVPALQGTAYDGVSIDQVLRMRSGVAFTEEYTDDGSDVADFMRASVIEQGDSADRLAAGYPRASVPGSTFNYNTAETQILGMLVRAVSEKSHGAYLEEKLWRPLGMEHDASLVLDRPGPTGVALAGCCLNAALRDWARFGQLHLQDGVWRGERLLPEGWVARATSGTGDEDPEEEVFYGYQWWIFDEGRYSAEGVHGQFIFVDPANEVVIAKASFWPVAWDDDLADETLAAFGAVARHLTDGR